MIILCSIYFVLSFIMAKIVLRLPLERCQLNWAVVSVWGIGNAVSGTFLYTIWFVPQPSISGLYWSLWLVFLAALPGMLWLNWQQIRLWKAEIRRRDTEIILLKDQLQIEQLVKKTRYYSIIEQVN